jgi:hypothetical protein
MGSHIWARIEIRTAKRDKFLNYKASYKVFLVDFVALDIYYRP